MSKIIISDFRKGNVRTDGVVVRVGDNYYSGNGAMCGDLQAAKVYRHGETAAAIAAKDMWERGGHRSSLIDVAITS